MRSNPQNFWLHLPIGYYRTMSNPKFTRTFATTPNEGTSGFLPVERNWMDKFIESGFIDTFRHFDKSPDNYTWWDMITRARDRNVGWRIDYFFIDENSINNLERAYIQSKIMGSDHCPTGIDIKY